MPGRRASTEVDLFLNGARDLFGANFDGLSILQGSPMAKAAGIGFLPLMGSARPVVFDGILLALLEPCPGLTGQKRSI